MEFRRGRKPRDPAGRVLGRSDDDGQRRHSPADGGVGRKRDARDTSCLVVSVMEVDAILLDVRNGARFVSGERQSRAGKSQLTDDGEHGGDCAQPPKASSGHLIYKRHADLNLLIDGQKGSTEVTRMAFFHVP